MSRPVPRRGRGLLARPAVRALTALAATTAPIAAQSGPSSSWPSTTSPARAAITGCTLMNRPKKRAGTRRRANRSPRNGTVEDSTPAAAAQARAAGVGGWCASTHAPTGTNSSAETPAAAAEPSMPATLRPTVRLSRM